MLGLYHGERGSRLWRQVWSNHKLKPLPPREVLQIAREALARGAAVPPDRQEIQSGSAVEQAPHAH
jgi:tRNA-dihydrouridine synthase A